MWAPHQREISHCSDGPTTLDHHLVDAGASHLIPWAGRIISFSRKAAAASAASAARLSASRTTTDWRNARFFFFFAAAAQPKKNGEAFWKQADGVTCSPRAFYLSAGPFFSFSAATCALRLIFIGRHTSHETPNPVGSFPSLK